LKGTPVTIPGRETQALPEMEDAYDGFDLSGFQYDTNEQSRFNALSEDWYGDPGLTEASKKRSAIVDATNPDGETVNGVHYSQEQIMSMTDARRFQLAREAMAELGFTESDRQANFEMQRALE